MYKLTLVLFASLIFFTTASYAENEVEGWRLALGNIEMEIAGLEEE